MKHFLVWIIFGLLLAGLLVLTPLIPTTDDRGPGEAIQGLYSHLDCDTQPGKRPWYEAVLTVDADGNESEFIYFLGCR